MRDTTAPAIFEQPIAWITESYQSEKGLTERRVIRQGMSRDELIAHFPPRPSEAGRGIRYNRSELCRAILYEAYRETQAGAIRERENVRGFWYERFMYTLRNVMGETATQNSLDGTINAAWKALVEGGWMTYADLNIYSEKERGYRIRVVPDSPYPTVVVLVEKESFFEALCDLADVYEISFVAAGGQASRAAAMQYVKTIQETGIDLARSFTVFSMADFDPEGWDIPEQFVKHMQTGGITGEIELIRLGVLRHQLGESVGPFVDVYTEPSGDNASAKKAKRTKWENWAAITGGIMAIDGAGNRLPGRVELNIYSPRQIRERIIAGLCERLDGFAFQVRALRESVRQGHAAALDGYRDQLEQQVDDRYEPYYEAIQQAIDDLKAQAAQRVENELRRIEELRAEIEALEAQAAAKVADLNASKTSLDTLRYELETEAAEEVAELWETAEASPAAEALVMGVESNGGWRHFADQVGIDDRLTATHLARCGQRGEPVTWSPSWYAQQSVNLWAYGMVDCVWNAPDGPDESPAVLIQQALQGAADD